MLHKSALDWVPVNVAEFLDKLSFAPDVEIIVSRLPEGVGGAQR
jgi:hypothetical protein